MKYRIIEQEDMFIPQYAEYGDKWNNFTQELYCGTIDIKYNLLEKAEAFIENELNKYKVVKEYDVE